MLRTTSLLFVTRDCARHAEGLTPSTRGRGRFGGWGLGALLLLGLVGCSSKERDFGEGTDKTQNGNDDAGGVSGNSSDTSTDESTDPSTDDTDEPNTDTAPTDTQSSGDDEPPATTEPTTDEPPPSSSETTDPLPDTSEPTTEPTEDSGAGVGGAGNEPTGTGGSSGSGEEIKGEAGSGNLPEDTSVNGQIIDFWNHPLPGVLIQIGQETTTTDDDGRFEFEAVPEEYDASFIASWSGGTAGSYAWRYEGLTRRDPVLQAFTGLPERSAHVTITSSNVTREEGMELFVAFGSPDGSTTHSIGANGLEAYPYWRGESATSSNFHALLWMATDDLPTAYLGYDTGLIALSESDEGELDVDPYENSDLTTGVVEGSVTSNTGADRTNAMFLQFRDGARIQLVDDYDGPDEFSYIAPTLPEASLVAVASEGWSGDAMAFAYRGGVTPGNAPTKLEIPKAPSLLTPTNGSTITPAETSLKWQGDDLPIVIHIESTATYEGFYIVTTKKDAPIGEFVGGAAAPQPGVTYTWEVQSHGRFASVDAIASEGGFLSPFSIDYESPLGPREGDGYFAVSARSGFTVAE